MGKADSYSSRVTRQSPQPDKPGVAGETAPSAAPRVGSARVPDAVQESTLRRSGERNEFSYDREARPTDSPAPQPVGAAFPSRPRNGRPSFRLIPNCPQSRVTRAPKAP
ncbi:hypothetical protein MRX96_055384 [Rhipicephalus microplus]